MSIDNCPSCGRTLDDHNRHIRFKLPEPVLDIPEHERPARTWGNDVLMQVKGLGSFVRILIPIKLSGGYTITFGAWLSVAPKDLHHAWEVWHAPTYPSLRLYGFLANRLPPWEEESYIKPIEAAVLEMDHVPYAVSSQDDFMNRLLSDEWPHEAVLDANHQ